MVFDPCGHGDSDRCCQFLTAVRRMMFSAMLHNEVGWFDHEENSPDTLSMRLANDATFFRAAFSNRLSILIQDSFAVVVALLIGLLLGWRLLHWQLCQYSLFLPLLRNFGFLDSQKASSWRCIERHR